MGARPEGTLSEQKMPNIEPSYQNQMKVRGGQKVL